MAWLHECHLNHKHSCAALRWSSENPTRLVKIVSDTELQLCSRLDGEVQYVALSYAWGSSALTEEDWGLLEKGMTTRANVESRVRSFPSSDLPATLRDALVLLRRLGVSYAWIDSICIIQDAVGAEDFAREAPLMHRYYGNALFTLAICSNAKATIPLLVDRVAYSNFIHPCHLRGRWLTPPLDFESPAKASRRSPLAKRAWTLQEEHLSPRIVYWTTSRVYWSCAEKQLSETMTMTTAPTEADIDQPDKFRGFLIACRQGRLDSMHKEWLSMLMSYSLRDMTNVTDRFAALSGLASRYRSSRPVPENFLAGLWQSTLAHDLSWKVLHSSTSPASSSMPSWTWASLPLCTEIEYHTEIAGETGFELVGFDPCPTINSDEGISEGSEVSHLRIRARLRPFWEEEAQLVPWSSIVVSEPATGPMFSFESAPELSLLSVKPSGMVVSYEARRQESVGQMDYGESSDRILDRSLRLYALQLTETTMLLLEKTGNSFRRVGMADKYRSGFFEGVVLMEVELV